MKNIFLLSLAAAIAVSACSRKPEPFEEQRKDMVRKQIEQRGIQDRSIVNAFMSVPREEFVTDKYKDRAYEDNEAPIGYEQSLDRPYENALMILALDIQPHEKVLEVGTGSGYLASLMSRIAKEVYTIEIVPEIADMARAHIARLGYKNIEIKTGDGFVGWPEHAPFDAIVLTCSPDEMPKPLVEQLAEGGRLVLPMGGTEKFQELILYEKTGGEFKQKARLSPTEFVPMKGKILEEEE